MLGLRPMVYKQDITEKKLPASCVPCCRELLRVGYCHTAPTPAQPPCLQTTSGRPMEWPCPTMRVLLWWHPLCPCASTDTGSRAARYQGLPAALPAWRASAYFCPRDAVCTCVHADVGLLVEPCMSRHLHVRLNGIAQHRTTFCHQSCFPTGCIAAWHACHILKLHATY